MKILIADDSVTMRRIVENILQSLGYDDLVQADCGEDVLKILKTVPGIELVLLDWNMPLMNGLDCLKAIRANPETAELPVVMVTSEATESRIVEAIKSGATHYLVKPFDTDKLAAVLAKVKK